MRNGGADGSLFLPPRWEKSNNCCGKPLRSVAGLSRQATLTGLPGGLRIHFEPVLARRKPLLTKFVLLHRHVTPSLQLKFAEEHGKHNTSSVHLAFVSGYKEDDGNG